MELDIVRGQIVAMHGYNCIVRHYDDEGAYLEYPNGEERYELFEDIAEQNEDLILEEEEYGYDRDDYTSEDEDW